MNVLVILAASLLVGMAGQLGGPLAGVVAAIPAGVWMIYRSTLAKTERAGGDHSLFIALMVVAAISLASPAFALEAATVPTVAPGVLAALQPIIELVVAAAVTAFLGWIYKRLDEWFGVQVEAKHRDALHSALTTAANLMLSQVAQVGKAKMQVGVQQVWFGAADAIRHFGLDNAKLEAMLQAKIQEADVAKATEPTPAASAIVARRKDPQA